MKVLLIANHKSVFGKELLENLLKRGLEVSLLDFETLKLFGTNDNEKYSNKFAKYRKLPKIHMIFRMFFIVKFLRENSFDIVNIHTARVVYAFVLPILSRQKLITTIYGSDFYRQGAFAKAVQKTIYHKSNIITFTNPLTMDSFLDYYRDFKAKSVVCRFGLGTLDFIDKNRNRTKLEIKNELGYSTLKTIVTCGYTSSSAQQHEKIIDAILKLDTLLLDRIQFIFPMTYGDKTYKEKIKNILAKTTLDYIVLENFLYEDKNATIKLSSDIMINMLTTDSFSGSMQEFLYASNVVITGSWLPYELFDKQGVVYKKINEPSELTAMLIKVLNDLPSFKKELGSNMNIIRNLSSWDNNIESWIKAYEN